MNMGSQGHSKVNTKALYRPRKRGLAGGRGGRNGRKAEEAGWAFKGSGKSNSCREVRQIGGRKRKRRWFGQDGGSGGAHKKSVREEAQSAEVVNSKGENGNGGIIDSRNDGAVRRRGGDADKLAPNTLKMDLIKGVCRGGRSGFRGVRHSCDGDINGDGRNSRGGGRGGESNGNVGWAEAGVSWK